MTNLSRQMQIKQFKDLSQKLPVAGVGLFFSGGIIFYLDLGSFFFFGVVCWGFFCLFPNEAIKP